MRFFSRFNPLVAIRDLRMFLAQRQKHELIFLALSLVITGAILGAFYKDSSIARPYQRNIIYVQQWRLDRTDAEIVAQQKIDEAARQAQLADFEKRRNANQAQFKRLDDSLKKMGI